ncbi:DNA sulfur modification protein DndB [Paenibacillus polymyxa]|uniref:DNA sulfur modification protein DndB n=1 Tax=Paenibacillus polymyxa TaxID=1406 RepID=UPI00287FD8D2|nr:DNA sulfur modification protein DndB [Paenibacillus polymyxa]
MELITLSGIINPIDNSNSKGLMTTQIKVKDLLRIYHIDSTVNRDINTSRIPKIVNYLIGYDSYPGVFFPSIMCAYSGNPNNDFDLNRSLLTIPTNEQLVIIDGQHRIKSLESLINNQKIDVERKNKILESDVTLQLYFGLSKDDMRNLFADINSNSVKVSMSLITAYDNRETLNILVRELCGLSKSLQAVGIEFNKSTIIRPKNLNFSTSVRLKKFICILLFNKKILNLKEEKLLKINYDYVLSFLERFFYQLISIFPEKPGNALKYILGHEAVQNAIAYFLNKQIISNTNDTISWVFDWEEKIEDLINIDWSVTNPIWVKYLIKARANTASEFYTIDIKDEKSILLELNAMVFSV